jgi:hypothetical protein
MDLVDEVMNLSGRDLNNIPTVKISEYIYTITQYVLYVQLISNVNRVKYKEKSRLFNARLRKAYVDAKIDKRLTSAEKQALAMSYDSGLDVLEKEVSDLESQVILLDKVPENFLEIANSLKKELSLRGNR